PATIGRSSEPGLARRRCRIVSGAASRRTRRLPAHTSAREDGSTIAPPPRLITVRVPAQAHATSSRSAARNVASPSSRKTAATLLPKRATIRWSVSTKSQSSRRARSWPIVVLPVPLKPTRTTLPGTDRHAHEDLVHRLHRPLGVGALDAEMGDPPDWARPGARRAQDPAFAQPRGEAGAAH